MLAAKPEDVNGRTAFDAAAQGDAAAQQVVDTYIHYLAVGIANLINIFFPEVIGLSGGVANQGENLLKPLRAAVEPMVFGHDFAQNIPALQPARWATAQGSSVQPCWPKAAWNEEN